MVLLLIVAATVLVSLISLLGIALLKLGLSSISRDRTLSYFVSFSAGAMLAAAFFDLLPESLESAGPRATASFALFGILAFFLLEKLIHWHHHHTDRGCPGKSKVKALGYMVLLGDGLHNFFDGVAIAAAFLVSVPVGVTTTIAVSLHEIPHELGDFSLLLYSGFSARTAAFYNLLSALAAVFGGIAFYYLSGLVSNLQGFALAFTFGNFLYIATVNLVPELHKEPDARKSLIQFLLLLFGIGAILALQEIFAAG